MPLRCNPPSTHSADHEDPTKSIAAFPDVLKIICRHDIIMSAYDFHKKKIDEVAASARQAEHGGGHGANGAMAGSR